jgi:hypothetical protein
MSKARLVITAVMLEGRSQADVARAKQVTAEPAGLMSAQTAGISSGE